MSGKDKKYKITILNWDKYQCEMRGGEKRRRRRDWVAISTDLFSDPSFFEMDHCHRIAWVGLLCHAGKVGPVFELCPSNARVMFQLRRCPDFEVFKNQGFIDLKAATDKTVHNKTDNTVKAKKVRKKTAKKTSSRFPEFKIAYPRKEDMTGAEKIWLRDNLDLAADEILTDVRTRPDRDPKWKPDANGKTYIPMPSTYLNRKRWEDVLDATPAWRPRTPEVVSEEVLQDDREKSTRELAEMLSR